MVHSVVSLFLAFVGLLFILYKLIATAAISSFDVLAKTSFPEEWDWDKLLRMCMHFIYRASRSGL